MSAIRRALEILDCFTEEQTNLTFEQIGQSTGLPKTTLYRNLRALLDFGLISESAPGHYIIGSRVLQLDYLARRCDPLLQVASEQAILLSEEFGSRSLICQDYADHVLCIFAVGGEGYHSAFDRGILRPYLRGAASLAILSTFNSYRVRKLYHQYAQNQSAEEFAALRQRLRLIRKMVIR